MFNRLHELYPGQRAEGQVLLDGQDVLARNYPLAQLRSRVGMVFQKPVPFPMTIYDNVAYGISHYEKLPRAEMDVRVEAALTRAALWDEVKDNEEIRAGLSGGQQQRLCIARAIAISGSDPVDERPGAGPVATARIEQLIEGTQAPVHDPDRDPQHTAGRALFRLHRLHVSGRTGERGRTDQIFTTDAEAHGGLHYRRFG